MTKPFIGLHVVLTGASGGVGEAILKQLSGRGARIFATSRTQEKLDARIRALTASSNPEIKGAVADFNFPAQIESFVQTALEWLGGRVDVLINNAGIGYHCAAGNVRIAEAIEVMTVNAIAPIIVTTQMLPALRRSAAPKVINISSILGSKPLALTSVYAASKHALNGYSHVLRIEEASSRLSVTVIEPGAIDTPFIERTHDPDAVAQMGKRRLQKLTADEVTRWVNAVIEAPPFSCPEFIRIAPMEQAI